VLKFFQNLVGRKRKSEATPLRDLDATVPLSPAVAGQLAPEAEKVIGADAPQRLRLGCVTDVGRVRDHNEDVLLAFTGELAGLEALLNFGLFAVADGMGGHLLGERASAIAARTVARVVLAELLPSLLADPLSDVERRPLRDVMENAVTEANTAVTANVPESGTTLICSLLLGEQLVLAHVGDSRAYLLTADGVEQLTHDHSLVQRLQEMGQITAAEAAMHPQRSILYRAVGQGDTLEVDIVTRHLFPGATILLCSDGLWSVVPDDKMLGIVQQSAGLQAACEALVAAANAAGGPDNISVIMVRLPEAPN